MSNPHVTPKTEEFRPLKERVEFLHPCFRTDSGDLIHCIEFEFNYYFARNYRREDGDRAIFSDLQYAMQMYFKETPPLSNTAVASVVQLTEHLGVQKSRHPRGMRDMFSYMSWNELFNPDKLIWLEITQAKFTAGHTDNTITAELGRIDKTFIRDPSESVSEAPRDVRRYEHDSPIAGAEAGFTIVANYLTGGLSVNVDHSVVNNLRFNLRGSVQMKHRRVER